MMRAVFPVFLTALALAGCEAPPAPGGGAAIMVPGRSYDATHSQEGKMRMKFMADGTVSVWEGGAWVAAGQSWFRRDGQLCTYGQYGGPEYAFCTEEIPAGNGGFNLIYEDAMAEFRPVPG